MDGPTTTATTAAVGNHGHCPPTTTTTATPTKDRREETTEEYPLGEDVVEEGANLSDNSLAQDQDDPAAVSATTGPDPGSRQGGKKPGAARRKKRKKKRREKPIPVPEVGAGEALVQIHTVWNRGRRTRGGYVVKAGDKVVRYIDSRGTVYCPHGEWLCALGGGLWPVLLDCGQVWQSVRVW